MPRYGGQTSLGLGLVLLCTIGAAGCTHSDGSSGSQSGGDASAYAQQEHHVPPYKPKDLPAALKSLRGRCAELIKHRSQNEPGPFTKEFQEALDIAGWLPEFGADSDLGEAEWNRINEASKRLVDQLSKLQATDSVGSAKDVREQIDSALDSVGEVLRRNADLFKPHPGPGQQ